MITRVYMENWKSHKESELTFSGGVNVLVGEMGAGKSSVLEAITFALYGTTPALQSRKITLDDVLRRTPSPANEAVVEVDFERDGTTYTVRRELHREKGTDHSELRADGELVEAPQTSAVTDEVTKLLGIDYDVFARVTYAEQNELDHFLTLRAGERKEQVDELLELDRFETARSTLVTVNNRLENRRQNRAEDLEQLETDIDEAEREELAEQLATEREELEKLQEQKEELAENIDETTDVFEELQEKKKQYNSLQEKQTALQTRIEAVDEQIEKLADELGAYAEMDADTLAAKRDEREEEQDVLAEQQEEIAELEKRLEVVQEKITDREERLEQLEDDAEQLEDLEDIEDALEEKQERLEQVVEQRQEVKTELKNVKESLQNLSSASETCPTCGRELDQEHRIEFLQQRKAEKQEYTEELTELQEEQQEIEETVAELQEEKEELLQLKGVDEDIEECKGQLDDLQEKRKSTEKQMEELQEAYDADRVEEIDEALDRIDQAADLQDLEEEREERVEQLDKTVDALDELEFDEDKLETVRERLNELKKDREVVKTKIENQAEMIEEREKRLEELEKQEKRLEQYREQIKTYRAKGDMLNGYLQALEQTQVELREQFINSVNETMQTVWQQIYPYDDYENVRLNAADGYALELQDADGEWISVEGHVSGGERHAAALTLRIALSILLAPSWRILILDEPTHNLDVTAIEDLADTLRTEVADIVGQLFVITHEERLETAVTGDLYKLRKKGTETGLTEVSRFTEAETHV